uniref:Uncharacterized protein n=1 Tax=Maylandia zebra TaxID=106582 RepID=A0A3P9B5A1_9CICH
VSLIKDSGFIKLISDEIQFYKQTNNREDTTLIILTTKYNFPLTDAMKAYLRRRTISYASFKKKAANKNIITLEAKLKALEAVHSHTKDRVTLNKIVKVKYKLNVLRSTRREPTQTRGEHANSTQKDPGLMLELNSGPSCCAATVLTTVPPCCPIIIIIIIIRILCFCLFMFKDFIKKLQASAKQGGFSLPNFQWYYWVMNVKQLRAWLPTAPVKPIWSHIETEVNGGISPWRELFDTSHKTTHPIIAKILWFKLHRAAPWSSRCFCRTTQPDDPPPPCRRPHRCH